MNNKITQIKPSSLINKIKKLIIFVAKLTIVISIIYVSWTITAILFIPFVLILALIGAKELILKMIMKGR